MLSFQQTFDGNEILVYFDHNLLGIVHRESLIFQAKRHASATRKHNSLSDAILAESTAPTSADLVNVLVHLRTGYYALKLVNESRSYNTNPNSIEVVTRASVRLK